ncbi:MAG: hypothetical protein GY777_09780 [Candidatus Brocadiaceae bacterium]|nr:hypothetical protein [Candidatus Brocadiaceae bacterium]
MCKLINCWVSTIIVCFIFVGSISFAQGPDYSPSGWDEGEKVGWDSDIPPGLDKNDDDFFYRLHTYEELRCKLDMFVEITKDADVEYYRMKAGPLILADRDGESNDGLVEIDDDEMENIMNTVPGNDDPSHANYQWNSKQRFGLSTMGRELLAVKVGNPDGIKVLVFTQQHGNEFTSTEAALGVLRYLTRHKKKRVKKILDTICLLIVVRANPDGGEPDPDRCVMADDIQDGVVNVGSPFVGNDGTFLSDCAFYRLNVDPRASEATTIDTGAIYGYYGHGFNLGRYHYANFDRVGDPQYGKSIYPVETQAMVAAFRAFQPEVFWDMHNDNEKIVCDDMEALEEQTLWFHSPFFILPMVRCNGEEKLVNTTIYLADVGGDTAKRLGAKLLRFLDRDKFGSAARYSQSDISLPPDSGIADDSYGRYQYPDGSSLIFSATHEVAAVDELSLSFQTDTDHQIPFVLGGDALPDISKRIALHRKGLKKLLRSVANGALEDVALGDNGWSEIPKPEVMKIAFNEQFIGVISDPWFYIVFGYLNPTDLASEPYATALELHGLGGVYSCDILSDYGLCQSVLDSNPFDHQEATSVFQEEWRVGLADIYLHNPQKLSINPIP